MVMSTLVLVALLGLMGPPQDFVGEIPSSPVPQSGPVSIDVDQSTPAYRLNADQVRALANRNTCYAIRSYIFRRQDGNAPVLVGTTTCTSADALRRQEVGPPPKVRLVPAN